MMPRIDFKLKSQTRVECVWESPSGSRTTTHERLALHADAFKCQGIINFESAPRTRPLVVWHCEFDKYRPLRLVSMKKSPTASEMRVGSVVVFERAGESTLFVKTFQGRSLCWTHIRDSGRATLCVDSVVDKFLDQGAILQRRT